VFADPVAPEAVSSLMVLKRAPILAVLALAAWAQGACASAPGERPVVLVNPYPAIGLSEISGSTATNKVLKIMQNFATPSATDVVAEHAGQMMGSALGRAVTVERKARGRSILGTRFVAESAPDGRTLLFTNSIQILTYPRLYELPYVPLRDFTPVAAIARMPVVAIAAAEGGPGSLQAFVGAARAAPGTLNYGSSGDFRSGHLAGELLRAIAGISVVHVAYNGGNDAVQGVLKRQVEIAFVPLPAALPALPGGKIRVLGIADRVRHETLPQVPTVREAGIRDFEAATWFGIFAPSGTPARIVARLEDGIAAGVRTVHTERLMLSLGLQARYLPAEEFEELIRAEQEKWEPVIGALVRPR
jgi:tripartite-type tricarboxylate transporter receptor subunit TctC